MESLVAPSVEAQAASHGKVVLLLILLGAFLLRLGAVLTSDPAAHPDSPDFLYHANSIIEGHYPDREIRGVFSFRAPLYPFLLSLFLRLFGQRFIFITLFQAVTGVALVYLIYLFARRLFDERAALVSAVLAAIYPHLIDPIRHIQTESVFTLLAVAATVWFTGTVVADESGDTRPLRWPAGAGVLYGLAILCRPSGILMILILGAWVMEMAGLRIREWKTTILPFLILLVSVGFVVLPWTLRNYIRFSEVILVSNQAGEVFWLGNNPLYFEMYHATTQEEFRAILKKMGMEQPAPADAVIVRRLTPGELDRYWWKKGWSYVSSSPREWIHLLFLKWVSFWRPWAVHPMLHRRGTLLLSAVFSVPVFVGGGIGMVQLWRTRKYQYFTLLLAIFVVHSLFFAFFFPTLRYRIPSVDVFLLALAGGGFGYLVTRGRRLRSL